MPSVKIVLREAKKYSDGTSPVMLRIIAGRKVAERQLCKVRPDDWNPNTQRVRRSHPRNRELNLLIGAKFQAADRLVLHYEAMNRHVVAEEIAQAVMNDLSATFTGHFRAYLEKLRNQGQGASADQYETHLNGLLKFTRDKEVSFGELTDALLLRFIKHSRENGRGNTTIFNYLNTFRIVWSDAVKRKIASGDPFAFVTVKKDPVRKTKLTAPEIARLEALDLSRHKSRHHARNFFLLQFYLRGVRISELAMLRRDHILLDDAGQPVYVQFASRKTDRLMAVKLHAKAQRLVAQYLAVGKGPYLMPYFRFRPDPKRTVDENDAELRAELGRVRNNVNNALKKIEEMMGLGKKLRSHVSRHSFANQADKKITDKRKISQMLGQSSFRTTEIYLADLRDDELDDAAAEVFD